MGVNIKDFVKVGGLIEGVLESRGCELLQKEEKEQVKYCFKKGDRVRVFSVTRDMLEDLSVFTLIIEKELELFEQLTK